jgi:hypothetical protein
MTDLGISNNYEQGKLERWAARLPLSITVRQAFSNVVRKRGRLAMTAITLTLASAAFMGLLAVTVSVISEVDAIFARVLPDRRHPQPDTGSGQDRGIDSGNRGG